jgi:hypothetical protein
MTHNIQFKPGFRLRLQPSDVPTPGSVAVFTTLIYLAIQTKQNSRLLRATIREQRTQSVQRLQLFAAEHFGEKGRVGDEGYYYAAVFSDWDTYVRQRNEGLIDEEDWDAQLLRWELLLKNDGMKNTWHLIGDSHSKELQRTINLILSGEMKEDDA